MFEMKNSIKLIKKNKKVKSVKMKRFHLIIITNPLFVKMKDKEFFIGSVKIKISRFGQIEVEAMHGNYRVCPHHMTDDSLCWGNFQDIYEKFRFSNPPDYAMLANLTINFIETAWNFGGSKRMMSVKKYFKDEGIWQ